MIMKTEIKHEIKKHNDGWITCEKLFLDLSFSGSYETPLELKNSQVYKDFGLHETDEQLTNIFLETLLQSVFNSVSIELARLMVNEKQLNITTPQVYKALLGTLIRLKFYFFEFPEKEQIEKEMFSYLMKDIKREEAQKAAVNAILKK